MNVDAALAAGAPACIVEADGVERFAFEGLPQVAAMAGLKSACGELAAAFLGQPSDALQVLAVTGTNGKTSTAWWLAQALTSLGRRCGVVGTLGIGSPPDVLSSGLTTPDPLTLQQAFRRFATDGFGACAIEASSIGIEEQRLTGTRIAVALLTNFTQDHLDYHGDMAAYWRAKRRLFDWPGLRAAVVNIDDDKGRLLADELADRPLDLWGYSVVDAAARLSARGVSYLDGGLTFEVVEDGRSAPVRSRLIGEFNVSNLLAVIGGLRAMGLPLVEAAAACQALSAVPGRMQRVAVPMLAEVPAAEVIVDYAHTPDALEKALATLHTLADSRGGDLWCVFGCGGNRDRGKRPLMAAVAERLSAHVVVTSDNPRNEAPAAIIADIVAGLRKPHDVLVIEDRGEAIGQVLRQAAPTDIVLIAGKGHENYQEIGHQRLPFSDVDVARSQLLALHGLGERGLLQ